MSDQSVDCAWCGNVVTGQEHSITWRGLVFCCHGCVPCPACDGSGQMETATPEGLREMASLCLDAGIVTADELRHMVANSGSVPANDEASELDLMRDLSRLTADEWRRVRAWADDYFGEAAE